MRFKSLVLILLLQGLFTFGQKKDILHIQFDQELNDSTLILEKVYLHTDRTNYVSGDDLWYKAYLVNAEDNCFTTHSNNLYVELISPWNEIVQRQNIQIYEGRGNGNFTLDEDLPSGNYHIRAYTNWMRNFEETLYYKPIHVINISDIQADSTPDDITSVKADIDLQFFPEGGSLLNDVNCTVAFKALNSLGKSIEVSGYIMNSDNDTLTPFSSKHLGMGKFSMIPEEGLEYFAKGSTSEGYLFSTKLPASLNEGVCLNVLYVFEDQIVVIVNTNIKSINLLQGEEFLIKNSCNQIYSNTSINITKLSDTIVLPTYDFPMGIAKLTLLNRNRIPFSERLVYIPKNQDATIKIKTDSQYYSKRSKVDLNLEILGIDKEDANISLTAFDMNSNNMGDSFPSNIASYFLLESEVNGFIEQAGYYFDPEIEDRLEALDLLLMTQGWRDFKWKYSDEKNFEITYPVENKFSIIERLRLYTDSIVDPPPEVNIRSSTNKVLSHSFIDDIREDAFYRSMIKTRYNLNDTIVLDEFEKVAKRITKEPMDNHFRIYREPRRSSIFKMTGKETGYMNVLDFLKGRVPGLTIYGQFPNYFASIRFGPVGFILDGLHVDIDYIIDYPLEEIDKVEVLKGSEAAIFGLYGRSGVVSILSKQAGYGLERAQAEAELQRKRSNHAYFSQRNFYAPKYDHSEPENETPDFRSTIHWEPYIYTDENNKAQISFYNADQITTIEIRAEGLTESGIPITGKTSYQIK